MEDHSLLTGQAKLNSELDLGSETKSGVHHCFSIKLAIAIAIWCNTCSHVKLILSLIFDSYL